MKQKHTTRRQRQQVRQNVEARIQELEQQQIPRRAALMILQMRQAATIRDQAIRSFGHRWPGGEEERT